MREQLEQDLIFNPHPLTNFEIQKHDQNEPKFNGVYSRYNLPIKKDEADGINLDDYESIGTHSITLYVNGDNASYFNSFGAKNILKEIKTFIGNENIIKNIFRLQVYDSIMYR